MKSELADFRMWRRGTPAIHLTYSHLEVSQLNRPRFDCFIDSRDQVFVRMQQRNL